jgi:hypothetical protein
LEPAELVVLAELAVLLTLLEVQVQPAEMDLLEQLLLLVV